MCESGHKKRHLFARGQACFRVIMNMNTGSTMQLSPNYWLCPEGWEDWAEQTRPTSTAGLPPSHCARPLHVWEPRSKRTIWQLHPSARHKIKEVVEREKPTRGVEESVRYFCGEVIWSNVWQWAEGLWNVSWLHLHIFAWLAFEYFAYFCDALPDTVSSRLLWQQSLISP